MFIGRFFDKSYITASKLNTNCVNIQNLLAVIALLYILDRDNKETYIQNAEAIVSNRIFKINISSSKLNAFGILGTWELYSQSELNYALRYYPEFVTQTCPDSVGYNGSSYPAARLNYDRFSKT
jgi:hypothetical protein